MVVASYSITSKLSALFDLYAGWQKARPRRHPRKNKRPSRAEASWETCSPVGSKFRS